MGRGKIGAAVERNLFRKNVQRIICPSADKCFRYKNKVANSLY